MALPSGGASAPSVTQVTIPSFDGTPIAATLFVPAGADMQHPVPFLLMTHGWAGARTSTLSGRVAEYVAAGYGVLTWDSRGFGDSGGEVQLDSVAYEVQDVKVLVTWLTAHAPVQFSNGPLVGMSGGSYAGGIQLLAAAFDPRIKAIAPEITWNDLAEALAPNGVPKLYWTSLLFGSGYAASCADLLTAKDTQDPRTVTNAVAAGQSGPAPSTGCQTSSLAQWYAEVHATNSIPADVHAALEARSPKTYMDKIRVPTLLIQGFPDTLFDVDQAVANYNGIKANGAPVKLWLYDGGHSHPENPSQVPNTQAGLIGATVIAWMDCHLKLPADCSRVGANVDYYTGSEWRHSDAWPPAGADVTTHVNGLAPLLQGPESTGNFGTDQFTLVRGPASVSGAVHVSFDLTGQAPESFLFASLQLVDSSGTATPVWGQTQPFRFATGALAPSQHVAADLVNVHVDVPAGSSLALVVSTTDPNYDNAREPGFVYVENVDATFRSDA